MLLDKEIFWLNLTLHYNLTGTLKIVKQLCFCRTKSLDIYKAFHLLLTVLLYKFVYIFKLINLSQQLFSFSILAPLWPIFLLPLPFFSNCAFCFCFCSGFNPLPAWAGCKTKQKPGHFSQCAVEAPYWKFSLLFVNILFAPLSQIERM